MAYKYDEKTGEFVDSPESKKEPQKDVYERITYTRTISSNPNSTSTTESVAGGCLKSIGKLLLYWLILAAIAGICSLFN